MQVRRLVGLRFPDDLIQGIDGLAQLVGAFSWLGVGLHRNHQILVSNPQIERRIAETFALVKPLGAERAEYLAAYPEAAHLFLRHQQIGKTHGESFVAGDTAAGSAALVWSMTAGSVMVSPNPG